MIQLCKKAQKLSATLLAAGLLCLPLAGCTAGSANNTETKQEKTVQEDKGEKKMETKELKGRNVGKQVRVHYRGTLNDGTQFDSSYDRGNTLDFTCGAGQMIKGFDAAVADMEVGQEVDVHLMPEEAYGPHNPEAVITMELAQLPGSEDLQVDQKVYLRDQMGRPVPVKVLEKTETTITFDANHELAGQELNFHIQLVEVK